MVASDRVSAFDVIMAEPIADKGRVLTAMTSFWCEEMADVVPGSIVAVDPAEIEDALGGRPAGRLGRTRPAGAPRRDAPARVHRAGLPGRAGLRGVRAGGHGARHGDAARTAAGQPAARADLHPVDQGGRGARRQHRLRRRRRPGGRRGGRRGPGHLPRAVPPRGGARGRAPASCWPTPSSSWATSTARSACATRCARRTRRAVAGRRGGARADAPAFDKQPLRDWLAAQPWDRTPPPPPLPAAVTAALSERYVAAYERVTGRSLDDWYGATP